MTYFGSKRKEIKDIYKYTDFKNITTIIEPFCGSCAISYYISTLHPKQYKYILNDNNEYLKDLFEIMKSDEKIKEFEKNILNIHFQIMDETLSDAEQVKKYNEITRQKNIYSWFYMNKAYRIRPGLFDITKKRFNPDKFSLKSSAIYNFFNTENIEFTTEDGKDCYDKYKNNIKNAIFIDPPYLDASNGYYKKTHINIYEYLYENDIKNEKAFIMLILADKWFIKLLFKDDIKYSYIKKYDATNVKTLNKNIVNHLIITNK